MYLITLTVKNVVVSVTITIRRQNRVKPVQMHHQMQPIPAMVAPVQRVVRGNVMRDIIKIQTLVQNVPREPTVLPVQRHVPVVKPQPTIPVQHLPRVQQP